MAPDLAKRKGIKDRLDEANFRVTLASTIVAVIAALAAVWSGYEAHKTRVNDERPFLAVNLTPATPNDPPEPNLPLGPFLRGHIINFGKSPAVNVRLVCATFFKKPKDVYPWNPTSDFTDVHYPYILPNAAIEMACTAQEEQPKNELTTYGIEMGVLQYQDKEYTDYQTPFCFNTSPVTGFDSKNMTAKVVATNVYPCIQKTNLPALK